MMALYGIHNLGSSRKQEMNLSSDENFKNDKKQVDLYTFLLEDEDEDHNVDLDEDDKNIGDLFLASDDSNKLTESKEKEEK